MFVCDVCRNLERGGLGPIWDVAPQKKESVYGPQGNPLKHKQRESRVRLEAQPSNEAMTSRTLRHQSILFANIQFLPHREHTR
jgi:hypothetical protein